MMLRRGLPAIAVLLLFVLLTRLWALSLNGTAAQYDRALDTLDKFEMNENGLCRDVLSAHIGLLHDYDPLVAKSSILLSQLGQLRQSGVDASVLDPLTALLDQQEALVERFKTNNALLQNALTQFVALSSQLDGASQDAEVAHADNALAAAMLHLTLDPSTSSAQNVADRLDKLADLKPSSGNMTIQQFLAQGRLLHDLLPASAGVVNTLYNLPRNQIEETIRLNVVSHQLASRAKALWYRRILYIVLLALFGLLIHFGLELRRRVHAQQRRATFEHVIAAISMRFAHSAPSEIGPLVEQALAEIAAWVRADRAYFISSGNHGRQHIWPDGHSAYPIDWPGPAAGILTHLAEAESRTVHIPRVERLPSGAEKTALVNAGVRGWIGVSSAGSGGTKCMLGFDTVRSPISMPADEIGLLRMAFDVFANAVARDVLRRERTRLETSLHRAHRMETIGALASGVAHNFNNIIGAIRGYTEIAEGGMSIDRQTARSLRAIRQACERSQDLVDQIFAFGRRRVPVRRPVHLHSLLQETASLLGAMISGDIQLVVGEVPVAAIVSGEFAQLQQVVINLCNNAAQAMQGSGVIDVMTDLHDVATQMKLTHGHLAPGRYVRLCVCDTGRGINEETLERIFEPFFTTRREGNGLGLATVRAIVSEHDGAINISSRIGRGSSFEVWLPAASAALAITEDSSAIPRGGGQTVMLVNDLDNPRLRDEDIIAALGYEPVGFADAKAALLACEAAPERFDATVISHFASPARALQLAVKLRHAAPQLPVILVAATDEIDVEALAAAGIVRFIARPLAMDELAAALNQCLMP